MGTRKTSAQRREAEFNADMNNVPHGTLARQDDRRRPYRRGS